jgi:MFS transporter, putative metabolite:H+ symporter
VESKVNQFAREDSFRGSEPSAQSIAQRLECVPPLPIHLRWGTIIGIGCFLDGFTTLIVAAALPVLITTLHIGFTQVGLLISAAFFGMFAGAITFGAFSERFGRRKVFAISIMLFGTLSICSAFAWNFSSLFWLRVIQGIGLGGAIPVAAALATECLPARARGRTFSLTYALLFAFGFVLAPLTGYVLIHLLGPALGWRVMFGVAGLALPFGISALWLLPESPRWLSVHGRLPEAEALVRKSEAAALAAGRSLLPATTAPKITGGSTKFSEAFSTAYLRRTVLVWMLFLTTYFVQYGLNAWLPTLYVKLGAMPPSRALALTVVNGCVTLGAAAVFALTVDRIGRKAWLISGFGLALVGIVAGIMALAVFHVAAWPVLFSAALPMTAGIGVNSGLVYLYAPELFPTRMRAWSTSTGSAAGRIGSIVAPIAIGALLKAGFGLVSIFVLLGVMCVLGVVIVIVFGIETKQRTLEDISS